MQLFKMSKLLVPCALLASVISVDAFAKAETFDVGFSTVPKITIIQAQAMDFGSGLSLASGVTCVMAVTGTPATYPGDIAMKVALSATTNAAPGANLGDISGTGCATLAKGGTPGLYEITAVGGGTVKVTVNNITAGTEFNFTATGCAATYVAGANGDSCATFTPGTPLSIRVADASDTVGNTIGSGDPAPGKALIAVGGTLTTLKVHTSDQALEEEFTIDVTY